jgi:hypothetical protein
LSLKAWKFSETMKIFEFLKNYRGEMVVGGAGIKIFDNAGAGAVQKSTVSATLDNKYSVTYCPCVIFTSARRAVTTTLNADHKYMC